MNVSIVTPSFNQAPYIERTILSVLTQDWPSIDYVICDGGSTDGTTDILKKYSDRLRWVSEKDDGQADAVNKGILATSGEIIGWINSDDIYYPGAIRAAAEYLASNPEIDVVYGMADHIDVRDQAYETYWTEPWNFDRMLWHCFICQPAAFFRRSVIERHGLLDVNLMYCMDYEYWLRLGAAGIRFGYLERKLAGSRMYPGNKTLAASVKVHKEINDMFRARLGQVPARWITNFAHVLVASRLGGGGSRGYYEGQLVLQSFLAQMRWNRMFSAEVFAPYLTAFQRRFKTAVLRLDAVIEKSAARGSLLARPVRSISSRWKSPADISIEPSRTGEGIRLAGVYEDGWARPQITVDYPAGKGGHSINLKVYAPDWLPHAQLNFVAFDHQGRRLVEYPVPRGQVMVIHIPVADAAGTVRIVIEPYFRPGELEWLGQPHDQRHLTALVQHMEVRDAGSSAVIFSRSDQLSVIGMPLAGPGK